MRTFVHSVALITLFAVITRAIGFIFRIFLSRILGAEMLGVYQLAMSVFMVFLTLIASGLPLAISKRVASGHTKGIVIAGLTISLVASTVSCLLVLFFNRTLGFLFTDTRCVTILIALIPSTVAASFYGVIRAVWWGEKRFFLLGITELMEQILRIIVFAIMLAFAFLFVDMAQIAAISYTVAFIIASVIIIGIYLKTRKLIKATQPQENQYKPLLKSAIPITGVRLITALTIPVISIIIVQRLVAFGWDNAAAISAFGILMGMSMPVLSIPQTLISSLATALVPDLSAAHTENKSKHVSTQIGNALKFTLFANFVFLPLFISLGIGVGVLMYANATSGLYISLFAWAMIPMSLSQITNAILNSLGSEVRAMKHYLIGSIALFASIWFLPQFVGISALVIGLGLCMGIASVLNLMLIAKLTKKHMFLKTMFEIFVFSALSAPCALLGYFVFGILQSFFGLFFALLLAGTLVTGSFLVLLHVFHLVRFDMIRVALKRS